MSRLTISADDLAEAVEEAAESGVGGLLVVDELDLDGLHGRHGEDGLADAGAEAAEHAVDGGEVAALVHRAGLEVLEAAEAEGGLGDGAVDEDGEAAVQAAHALLRHRLPHAVQRPVEARLGRPLVQLQLRLHELRRVRDADLDPARYAPSTAIAISACPSWHLAVRMEVPATIPLSVFWDGSQPTAGECVPFVAPSDPLISAGFVNAAPSRPFPASKDRGSLRKPVAGTKPASRLESTLRRVASLLLGDRNPKREREAEPSTRASLRGGLWVMGKREEERVTAIDARLDRGSGRSPARPPREGKGVVRPARPPPPPKWGISGCAKVGRGGRLAGIVEMWRDVEGVK